MQPPNIIQLSLATFLLLSTSLYGQSFLEQLEKQINGGQANPAPAKQPAQPATPAQGKAGYLGLYADDANAGAKGIRVTQLVVGGPANQAGIRAGDTITAIDGEAVSQLADMVAALEGKPAGTRIRFEVVRAGKATEHVVELGEKNPRDRSAPAAAIPDALPIPNLPRDAPTVGRASLGITVTDVTDADVIRYGFRARRGAIVRSIKDGAPVKRFGVSVGSLIIAANGRNVAGANDLVTVISTLTPDDSVELSYYTGKQLFTKTIPLGNAAIVNSPPRLPSDPPIRILPPGENRPILRGLERALNDIVTPPTDAAAIEDENTALRREVQSLRAELKAMRAHVAELEEQLAEKAAAD